MFEKKLTREHWLSLDQGIEEDPFATVLLNDVEDFEVNFIDGSEKKLETWPTTQTVGTGKPVALSFSITLADFGQITRILEITDGALQPR